MRLVFIVVIIITILLINDLNSYVEAFGRFTAFGYYKVFIQLVGTVLVLSRGLKSVEGLELISDYCYVYYSREYVTCNFFIFH